MRPRRLLPLLAVPAGLLLTGGVHASPPTLASADAAFAAGKFDQARKSYAPLVKADPKSPPAYTGLILSQLRQDQWRDALKSATSAVAADPKAAEAHGLLALSEIRAGEPEAAGEEAKLSLALDKDNY